MKIFEKRPLALILCIMLGGFSFFINFDWKTKLILSAISLLLISIIYIFDDLKRGRSPLRIASLSALSLSLILSAVFCAIFFPSKLYDSEVMIEAKVYGIDNSDQSTSTIIFKSEKINGIYDRHTFISYVDKEEATSFSLYDVVSFKAVVSEFSNSGDFNSKTYYAARGYSASLNELTDIQVHNNEQDYFDALFKGLRLKISNRLKLLSDFDTGAFLSALIVGDRSDLSGSVRLNFARLGISHILALSGMHLAILSFAINFLLINIGVKKKLRVTFISILVLIYMALTGFTASVLRSGLMLIISSVLFLTLRKSDHLTSLVISVSIIVLLDPASVYDMSLWLSAFATLGVIVFSDLSEKPNKDDKRIKSLFIAFKNACLVSVFAFCATFVFTALRFDYFSVASVFTTLIFSFAIQFFIYGGMILLFIGGIIPFGKLLILFSEAISWLAELISSIKYIYVSMNPFLVKLLIVLLTVFFFAFLVLEIKDKRKGICIIVAMLLSVFAAAEISTVVNVYDDEVKYVPSKSGDAFILKSDGELTTIYSGKAVTDDSRDFLELFADEGIGYLDNFVFASYSYSTVDFSHEIIDGIKIERVMLPVPNTVDEIAQAEMLADVLSRYGTCLEFYDKIEYISFGDYQYRLFDKVDYTYGKYPENVFEIVYYDERITYVSVCDYSYLSPSAKALMFNSDNLIIGSVGNTNYYLFEMHLPEIENIFYFDEGRITDKASTYYKEKGASMHCIKTPLILYD